MEPEQFKTTLNQLLDGSLSIPDVVDRLVRSQSGVEHPSNSKQSPSPANKTALTSEACVDLGRAERCGFPEVVYGRGKTPKAIVGVFEALTAAGQACLATLVNDEQATVVQARFPDVVFNKTARTLRISPKNQKSRGLVAVVSAGTSDLPHCRRSRRDNPMGELRGRSDRRRRSRRPATTTESSRATS